MPIYEYACKSCGHELETLQKLSDPPLTDCPECGRAELRKKVSAAGFRLKGSGWYETDFKKDGKKNLAGDDKADKGDKAGKDSDSGSTKSESGDGKSGAKGSKDAKAGADKPKSGGSAKHSAGTGAGD